MNARATESAQSNRRIGVLTRRKKKGPRSGPVRIVAHARERGSIGSAVALNSVVMVHVVVMMIVVMVMVVPVVMMMPMVVPIVVTVVPIAHLGGQFAGFVLYRRGGNRTAQR
jgi:hypothetical protein